MGLQDLRERLDHWDLQDLQDQEDNLVHQESRGCLLPGVREVSQDHQVRPDHLALLVSVVDQGLVESLV